MNLSVYLDEFEHYIGGGSYLVSVLAQFRKAGLEITMLCQNPPIKEILQNTEIHAWGKQGNVESARQGAEDIGVPSLDPKMVSHYEERTAPVGYEEVMIGDPENPRPISRTVYAKELIERYRSHKDQIDLKQKELMNLQPGWRFVRDSKGTRLEYVQPLKRAYPKCLPTIGPKRREEAISRIKAGPQYRSIGEIEIEGSSSGSPSTRPPRDKSRKSSSKRKSRGASESPSSAKDDDSATKELFSSKKPAGRKTSTVDGT